MPWACRRVCPHEVLSGGLLLETAPRRQLLKRLSAKPHRSD